GGGEGGGDALAATPGRPPLHRHGDTVLAGRPPVLPAAIPAVIPAIGRERWGVAVRDALRKHLRAAGRPIPDEDGQLALLAHPAQAALRAQLGIMDAPAAAPVAAMTRPLTIANLRGFL